MFKQLIHSNKKQLIGALLLAISGIATALPSDRDQAIQIDADSAERSEKTGVTSYMGSVELIQGSLNILADRIDIYTINGEVDHAIATGKRAYFTQQQSIDKKPVKAWALTIKYYLNDEIINLLGDARIEQDGSTVNSPEIDYYADQELVKAKGGTQGGKDRVHVTLPPQNKSGNDSAAPVATPDQQASTEAVEAAIEPVINALTPIVTDLKASPDNTIEIP